MTWFLRVGATDQNLRPSAPKAIDRVSEALRFRAITNFLRDISQVVISKILAWQLKHIGPISREQKTKLINPRDEQICNSKNLCQGQIYQRPFRLILDQSNKKRMIFFWIYWYGYRIDTKKAINDLNLKVETESELMTYCDFFKNVADTKQ